jgi:hypothetical protein
MPQPQNYSNHIRFYPPHHFVFYPLMLVVILFGVWQIINDEGNRMLWVFVTLLSAVIVWLAWMLRQHYALTLQNRLVLLELRYRYFTVTGKHLEEFESQLTEGQLFALRFAPDDEIEALAERAVKENLSPNTIKKSIKHWRPDNRRV